MSGDSIRFFIGGPLHKQQMGVATDLKTMLAPVEPPEPTAGEPVPIKTVAYFLRRFIYCGTVVECFVLATMDIKEAEKLVVASIGEILSGCRIRVPVCELEFTVGGDTIWVHSPKGATVLRIKTTGGPITVDVCQNNPVSHLDLVTKGELNFCLSMDAKVD